MDHAYGPGGGGHIPLLWTHLIPATLRERAHRPNVQKRPCFGRQPLRCFSRHPKLDSISSGLRTFESNVSSRRRTLKFNEAPFQGCCSPTAQIAHGRRMDLAAPGAAVSSRRPGASSCSAGPRATGGETKDFGGDRQRLRAGPLRHYILPAREGTVWRGTARRTKFYGAFRHRPCRAGGSPRQARSRSFPDEPGGDRGGPLRHRRKSRRKLGPDICGRPWCVHGSSSPSFQARRRARRRACASPTAASEPRAKRFRCGPHTGTLRRCCGQQKLLPSKTSKDSFEIERGIAWHRERRRLNGFSVRGCRRGFAGASWGANLFWRPRAQLARGWSGCPGRSSDRRLGAAGWRRARQRALGWINR